MPNPFPHAHFHFLCDRFCSCSTIVSIWIFEIVFGQELLRLLRRQTSRLWIMGLVIFHDSVPHRGVLKTLLLNSLILFFWWRFLISIYFWVLQILGLPLVSLILFIVLYTRWLSVWTPCRPTWIRPHPWIILHLACWLSPLQLKLNYSVSSFLFSLR